MLKLVEGFIDPIRGIETETDARSVLRRIAEAFGFRSGVLIEYDPGLRSARRVIDSDPERGAQWAGLFRTAGFAVGEDGIRAMLETDSVMRLNPERFETNHPYRTFAARYDLGQTVTVPISQGAENAGIISYSGHPPLDRQEQLALQLLSYNVFSQVRLIGRSARREPPSGPALTPREKEVMQLSANGLTSVEIAEALGLSPRTVNQHVDNVAAKLGTRNRTHTIAELLRNGMLN